MSKILWIDVMKGLGMLTVVAGHIYIGEISRNIFIFHMPLFFFISGYLFKPRLEHKQYLTKKTVHLLIPYFLFLIPLYVLFTSFPSRDKEEIVMYFAKPIIGGRLLKEHFTVFWFITCLFLTQQVMNYLVNKLSSKKLFLLMVLMVIISYTNTYIFPKLWLPWNANVVLASLPIFYIGYMYRQRTFKINNILLGILGVVVILFSFYYPENVYDMKTANYGIPIITLVSSLILILNIKYLSEKLSNYKFSYRVFAEIGKASMVIMYLHQSIQILTKSYFSDNNTIRFFTATIVSYLIYLLLSKFRFSRAFFLGSYTDLKEIFKPLKKT